MVESYEIKKQQLFLLIAVSIFLASLFFILGLVVGSKNDDVRVSQLTTKSKDNQVNINHAVSMVDKNSERSISTNELPYETKKYEPETIPYEQPQNHASTPTVNYDPGLAFSVQVTSVRRKQNALNLMEKLESDGYPTYISKIVYDNKRINYRVRVGPYPQKSMADQVGNQINKKMGRQAWTLRVNPDQEFN